MSESVEPCPTCPEGWRPLDKEHCAACYEGQIERLNDRIEALEAALRWIVNTRPEYSDHGALNVQVIRILEVARAALAAWNITSEIFQEEIGRAAHRVIEDARVDPADLRKPMTNFKRR